MTEKTISTFQKWMISIRPFALPASLMPVLFGTTAAVFIGGAEFKPVMFILAIIAIALIHSGSNLLNDHADFKKGVDVEVTPVSGGVIRGIISEKEAMVAAIILFATGGGLGLIIAYFTGLIILYIGIVGVVIAIIYTFGGKLSLKYIGVGDFAVFFDFGVLGSLGAWVVQTGTFSWIPVIWSIPMAILVIAILHANNWRDLESDKNAKITTIAGIIGDKGSLIYYGFLIFSPFVIILGLIYIPFLFNTELLPKSFLITLLGFPFVLKLFRRGMQRGEKDKLLDFISLDGATAQFNLIFGLLCFGALLLHPVLNKFY